MTLQPYVSRVLEFFSNHPEQWFTIRELRQIPNFCSTALTVLLKKNLIHKEGFSTRTRYQLGPFDKFGYLKPKDLVYKCFQISDEPWLSPKQISILTKIQLETVRFILRELLKQNLIQKHSQSGASWYCILNEKDSTKPPQILSLSALQILDHFEKHPKTWFSHQDIVQATNLLAARVHLALRLLLKNKLLHVYRERDKGKKGWFCLINGEEIGTPPFIQPPAVYRFFEIFEKEPQRWFLIQELCQLTNHSRDHVSDYLKQLSKENLLQKKRQGRYMLYCFLRKKRAVK